MVEAGDTYCHWYHAGSAWGQLPRHIEHTDSSFRLTVELPSSFAERRLVIGLENVTGEQKVVTALPVIL
jgi:hypothetical protein